MRPRPTASKKARIPVSIVLTPKSDARVSRSKNWATSLLPSAVTPNKGRGLVQNEQRRDAPEKAGHDRMRHEADETPSAQQTEDRQP